MIYVTKLAEPKPGSRSIWKRIHLKKLNINENSGGGRGRKGKREETRKRGS